MNPLPSHNPAASRFELAAGSSIARLDYLDQGDMLVLTHTYVPPELRGQGLAGLLVRAALEFARKEGRRVDPQCTYAAAYLEGHPEFADLRKSR